MTNILKIKKSDDHKVGDTVFVPATITRLSGNSGRLTDLTEILIDSPMIHDPISMFDENIFKETEEESTWLPISAIPDDYKNGSEYLFLIDSSHGSINSYFLCLLYYSHQLDCWTNGSYAPDNKKIIGYKPVDLKDGVKELKDLYFSAMQEG